MGIDTQNKRRSVQAYTLGLVRPLADGTISAADRATSSWHYSGLTYSPPVAGGHGLNWLTSLTPFSGIGTAGLSKYGSTGLSVFIALLLGGRRDHACA